MVFEVAIAPDGTSSLRRARRAVVRSVAKLGYETATAEQLPDGFGELASRIAAAEEARGASRVEFPEQEVATDADGRMRLVFQARTVAAAQNSALSLATNLAVATTLLHAGAGLFRVMPEPDARAVKRLRYTAHALGLNWPRVETLGAFQRRLDPSDARAAAFLLAVRRAGGGAGYARFEPGVTPWHAAMAATYAQATAPLRRLADRYVIEATLAASEGRGLPGWVDEGFDRLPKVMDAAEARNGQIDRAVLDLAESIALEGREGQTFDAVVTDIDERGSRIQIADPAIVARLARSGLAPGDAVSVRLVGADPRTRTVRFE